MRKLLVALGIICHLSSIYSQQKVTFFAEDSLKITADLYLKDFNLPFILLFHQGDASRGEYSDIALKLMKLDYNCLAVDLRSGKKINYIINETAELAKKEGFPHSMLDAAKDIKAAIKFVSKYNTHPPILVGSSYSASLCLLEAAVNKNIKAVIALSPGEYFRPYMVVKDGIASISQPVFISATSLEYNYIVQMISVVPESNVHIFQSEGSKGEHGAGMLSQSGESADKCWLELMLFFKGIRY
jgi:pimeloyl-ACP methyl ester carboxylesterase